MNPSRLSISSPKSDRRKARIDALKRCRAPYLMSGEQSGIELKGNKFAGVDVGKDYLCYVIRLFADDGKTYLLDHDKIQGDIKSASTWRHLARRAVGCKMIAVDCGFEPDIVLAAIKQDADHIFYGLPIVATKGANAENRVSGLYRIDKRGVFLVNVSALKSRIDAQIKAGSFLLPADISDDYLLEIAAEERRIVPGSASARWIKTNTNNHYFDAEVLAIFSAFLYQSRK